MHHARHLARGGAQLPHTLGHREAVRSYRTRWATEGSYRDAQGGWDGQHGWDLEPVLAAAPDAGRAERLLGLWALGALVQTFVGAAVQHGPAEVRDGGGVDHHGAPVRVGARSVRSARAQWPFAPLAGPDPARGGRPCRRRAPPRRRRPARHHPYTKGGRRGATPCRLRQPLRPIATSCPLLCTSVASVPPRYDSAPQQHGGLRAVPLITNTPAM